MIATKSKTTSNTSNTHRSFRRLGHAGEGELWEAIVDGEQRILEVRIYGPNMMMRRVDGGEWRLLIRHGDGWQCDCPGATRGRHGCYHVGVANHAFRPVEYWPDEETQQATEVPGVFEWVKRDMDWSAEATERLIVPLLAEKLDSRVVSVETQSLHSEPCELLDLDSAVDLLMLRDGLVFGVAVRIQPTDDPFDTFTVRLCRENPLANATEYDKLRRALNTPGAICPAYHLQAYISNDRQRLLTAAMCNTRDLVAMIEAGEHEERKTGNGQQGKAKFACVNWTKMGGRYPVTILAHQGR